MKKKIMIDLLVGDKRMNDFMHAADVFEPGKQLISGVKQINGILADGQTIDTVCDKIRQSLEDNFNVVLVAIHSINGKRQKDPKAYIMPNVQTVSLENRWGLFKDILIDMGYEVKTTNQMHVLSIEGIVD